MRGWRLILVTSLLGTLAPAQDPIALAEAMWASFKEVPWQSGTPGATCQRYQGDSGWHSADEVWCRLCSREMPPFSTTSAYYVLDQLNSTGCRLGQFRATSTALMPSLAEQLHGALSQRLQKQFGPGQDPGRVQGWGSAYWKSPRLFESKELWVLLFVNSGPGPFPSSAPRVEILARHWKLLALLEQDKRVQEFAAEFRQERNRRLDRELALDLTSTLPKLAALLESKTPDAPTLRTHIEILWRMASTASGPPKPLLLLAIDRLADRLALSLNNEDAESEAATRTLTSAGLIYRYSHLGTSWGYTHNLLPVIWKQHDSTPWGEEAFVQLQLGGWWFGAGCPREPALFRAVIAHGEEFLAGKPESPRRADVAFTLALAYETWWSVSQASEKDSYVSASQYQTGAQDAHRKAMAHYEVVLRASPSPHQALYSRHHLARLKLGYDTNQRWYFCIYD